MTYEAEGQQLIDHELKAKEAAAVREHQLKKLRIEHGDVFTTVMVSIGVAIVAGILSSVVTCSVVHAPESVTKLKEKTVSVRRLERLLKTCVDKD